MESDCERKPSRQYQPVVTFRSSDEAVNVEQAFSSRSRTGLSTSSTCHLGRQRQILSQSSVRSRSAPTRSLNSSSLLVTGPSWLLLAPDSSEEAISSYPNPKHGVQPDRATSKARVSKSKERTIRQSSSETLQLGFFQGNLLPSAQRFFGFCCKSGKREIRTAEDEKNFFCIVMLIKSLQTLFIAIFVETSTANPDLHKFLAENHRYWIAIPLGFGSILVTAIRLCSPLRNLAPVHYFILLLLVTFTYGYTLASIGAMHGTNIISKVSWLLPPTMLFLTLYVVAVNISVTKKMIYVSAALAILFFAVAIAVLSPVYENHGKITIAVDIWLSSVIAAEVLVVILIFELQSIIRGERGKVCKHDFWFVSLYL